MRVDFLLALLEFLDLQRRDGALLGDDHGNYDLLRRNHPTQIEKAFAQFGDGFVEQKIGLHQVRFR